MEIKEVAVGDIANGTAAAPVEAPVDAQEQAVESQEVEVNEPEPKIDYQALYDEEKEKRQKAEYTIYKNKKEEKAKRVELSDPTAVVDHEELDRRTEEKVLLMMEAQRQNVSWLRTNLTILLVILLLFLKP